MFDEQLLWIGNRKRNAIRTNHHSQWIKIARRNDDLNILYSRIKMVSLNTYSVEWLHPKQFIVNRFCCHSQFQFVMIAYYTILCLGRLLLYVLQFNCGTKQTTLILIRWFDSNSDCNVWMTRAKSKLNANAIKRKKFLKFYDSLTRHKIVAIKRYSICQLVLGATLTARINQVYRSNSLHVRHELALTNWHICK